MTIIRAPRAEHYTTLGNSVINDDRLSFRALGLLTYLLSKPDNWRVDSDALCRPEGREGRDAIRSALTELEAVGYLKRDRTQDERGRWATKSYVYDMPTDDGIPVVGDPWPGELAAGEPTAGKPGALVSTENKDPDKEQHPAGAAAAPTVTQRSRVIANLYADAEPMCRWPAINAIVIRAIKAGRWSDDEISAALLRLAAEGRPVTVDTLRIELDGLPPTDRRQREVNGRYERQMARALARMEEQGEPSGNGHSLPQGRGVLPAATDG